MKQITTYINEKLRLSAKPQYTCQPKDYKELRNIIIQRIENEGNECDLNDIDTSKITDMAFLFETDIFDLAKDFNCDISLWNVSNVYNMAYMFSGCKKFNCDLSMWNVSKVENMDGMFYDCEKFNQDLNNWDVSKVKEMQWAFFNCPTTPTWYDKNRCEPR